MCAYPFSATFFSTLGPQTFRLLDYFFLLPVSPFILAWLVY